MIDYRFKHLFHVIWYDGPLLSLFLGSDGNTYFWYWVDVDTVNNCNVWLVYRQYEYYVGTGEGKDIEEEILRNDFVDIVSLNNDLKEVERLTISREQLLKYYKHYLPDE